MSHRATKTNAERAKPTCHHSKKLGHYRNQCRQLKRQKEHAEGTQTVLETTTEAPIALSPITTTTKTTKTVTELKESQKLFTHPVRHLGKQTLQIYNKPLQKNIQESELVRFFFKKRESSQLTSETPNGFWLIYF